MSEREEYTPDTGAVRAAYTRAMRQAFIASTSEHIAEFDRWLAAHDQALREQIEREVRADMFRGVRAWVERFSPGDRWDPQDAIDLESALLGIVEANPDRIRARGEGAE